MKAIRYAELSTPIGGMIWAASEEGLIYAEFGEGPRGLLELERWLNKKIGRFSLEQATAEEVHAWQTWLDRYFAGDPKPYTGALKLYGTPFQLKVWQELMYIPYGETVTYKTIATALGAPQAVRAVGQAVHANPLSLIIPCHRVIGSSGDLVGYGGGIERKKYLLDHEHKSRFSHT
ncbi:MAG: methylated-DNA--[protein]-cysteine S-methyltransferase [Candidatus Carbobacillus altaicus]|nr:methylated-DNA--[protein]-cysteine S-methyltransferase [Candidatus Carbobacillus altaicus]